MKNADLARRFADAHLDLEFDAVLIDATVEPFFNSDGRGLCGSIFLDQRGRFEAGGRVTTSRIMATEAGGRVIVTRNTRYLVQMAPETEEARREAANENAESVEPCALCRDGWPKIEGVHELPEPAASFRCANDDQPECYMFGDPAAPADDFADRMRDFGESLDALVADPAQPDLPVDPPLPPIPQRPANLALAARLETCAEQSEIGRNFADTPHACREAAAVLRGELRG